MSNFIWGKDPEDAPLGTHTYRCKGCNGKNCKYCCFGDMWEPDPYYIEEEQDDQQRTDS